MEHNVMIGIPDYGGSIRTECVQGLLSLAQGGITKVKTVNCPSVRIGRNILASSFLADASLTHLLFVDTDIGGFTVETVRLLINADREVIGALYATKTNPPKVAAQITAKDVRSYVSVEAKSIGLGLCLIRRNVFADMAPDVNKRERHGLPVTGDAPLYGFFDPISENGVLLEEDYSFCRRCSEHDIKIMGMLCPEVFHVGDFRYMLTT